MPLLMHISELASALINSEGELVMISMNAESNP